MSNSIVDMESTEEMELHIVQQDSSTLVLNSDDFELISGDNFKSKASKDSSLEDNEDQYFLKGKFLNHIRSLGGIFRFRVDMTILEFYIHIILEQERTSPEMKENENKEVEPLIINDLELQLNEKQDMATSSPIEGNADSGISSNYQL